MVGNSRTTSNRIQPYLALAKFKYRRQCTFLTRAPVAYNNMSPRQAFPVVFSRDPPSCFQNCPGNRSHTPGEVDSCERFICASLPSSPMFSLHEREIAIIGRTVMRYLRLNGHRETLAALALLFLFIFALTPLVISAQNLGGTPQVNKAVQGHTAAQPEGAFLNLKKSSSSQTSQRHNYSRLQACAAKLVELAKHKTKSRRKHRWQSGMVSGAIRDHGSS